MSVAETMRQKLEAAFAPSELEIVDDSHKHQGHAGWREGGETHFHVRLVAAAFAGKSRIERQRMVYRVLAEELAGPVHALSLEIGAPD